MIRTFKVVEEGCLDCVFKNECKITGISRNDVYQSLGNAKLYAFVDCKDNGVFSAFEFMQVEEEINKE